MACLVSDSSYANFSDKCFLMAIATRTQNVHSLMKHSTQHLTNQVELIAHSAVSALLCDVKNSILIIQTVEILYKYSRLQCIMC